MVKNGEKRVAHITNGVYKTQLSPGEGEFIIIPKADKVEVTTVERGKEIPLWKIAPSSYEWKEDFSTDKNCIETYNVYGSGNSHFEFVTSGYPEGGSGNVIRLSTTTSIDKDWSTYKFKFPPVQYDPNKKFVFKMFFNICTFTCNVGIDNMVLEYPVVRANTLARVGEWSYFEVNLKDIWHAGIKEIDQLTMCIGNGIPYGTFAYIDEIYLCEV